MYQVQKLFKTNVSENESLLFGNNRFYNNQSLVLIFLEEFTDEKCN